MDGLRVTPNIEVEPDRVHGCTPWVAQLLVLFAYCRYVTVDRLRRQVVATRWFWLWQQERTIPFDRVVRIIYRAQGLRGISPPRSLAVLSSDPYDSAFFLISLAIKQAADDKRASDEITLFTVWEQQPRTSGWIDRLAGIRSNPWRVGDESSGAIVDILREYLGVPVASH